ncbi:MAG: LiaI-LiaF-like domain-containing protein [Runella sp.]
MKQSSNSSLFWGATLLGIGFLFLAKALGWLDINWGMTLRFWPVLLILAGVSLLLRQSWSSVAAALLIALAIPTAIINGTHKKLRSWEDNGIEFNLRDFDDESGAENKIDTEPSEFKNTYSEPMNPEITEATLNFEAGAGKFEIEGTSDQLAEAHTDSQLGSYLLSTKRSNNTSTVSLRMEDKIDLESLDDVRNNVKVHLNPKPIWSFDIAMGAGKGRFDLSEYKVKNIKMSAGATKLNLKLGQEVQNEAQINIEAGATSIEIDIPESVGCEFSVEGAFNARKLEDFVKVGGGVYRTPNYDQATKKIKITYEGGLSKVKINRY